MISRPPFQNQNLRNKQQVVAALSECRKRMVSKVKEKNENSYWCNAGHHAMRKKLNMK